MANTLNLGTDGNWGVKKDSLLGYNSENGNFKPLPFDFTRASSGTVVNKDGLIETVGSGEPRIDFKDNTKGALLLEPSRTNYITQSNDFSGWGAGNLYVTSNYAISPDGTQNASRCLFTDANQLIITPTSATGTLSGSMYVKGVSGETIQLSAGGGEDLIALTGEWQRLIVTKTNINGTLNLNTFAGATARDLLIYGAQLEQGSYATSYIPTSGSAVTRVAESDVSLSNLPIFDYTVEDFSISFKITTKSFDSVFSRVLSKASTSSGYEVFIENNGAIYFRTVASGVGVFSYTNPNQIVLGVESNITITRSGAVGKIYKDGIEITSVYANHSNISSSSSNNLRLGSYVQSGYNFSGQIKDVKLYNTALTTI